MEICLEIAWGCLLALKNKNFRRMAFLEFISDLSRDWPVMVALIPPQRPHPGGNKPSLRLARK